MTTMVERTVVVSSMRPRYEGANIRTWIGFKHLMYLAEHAVLAWFRHHGAGPQRLFHEYGLALEIVDSSVLLPALLEIDDEVVAEASALGGGRFSVKLRVDDAAAPRTVLSGKIAVRLIQAEDVDSSNRPPLPEEIASIARIGIDAAPHANDRRDVALAGTDPEAALAAANPAAFLWRWQARYFHCYYSDHAQHSSFVRALEEVVERFLADRGLSVGRMLIERALIPVVSRVRVQALAPVHMEEDVYTTFVVDDVLKGTAYDGRMDGYVRRGDALIHVATARILHGYAHSAGPHAGTLATLDADVLDALTGRRRQ